jgi:hypothetical protein
VGGVLYFICQNVLGKGEWKDRTKEVMEKVIQPGRANFFMDDPFPCSWFYFLNN